MGVDNKQSQGRSHLQHRIPSLQTKLRPVASVAPHEEGCKNGKFIGEGWGEESVRNAGKPKIWEFTSENDHPNLNDIRFHLYEPES